MQDGSDANNLARRSVSLLKTATVGFLVIGLLSSLYHTYLQQLRFLEHDSGAYIRYAPIGQFVTVAFLLLGLLQVYAVLLLTRPPIEPAVKGIAVLSLSCLGVNVLFNLGSLVTPETMLPWFASTKWMVLLSLIHLCGVLLLMASVLRVSRRAVDALAVAFVVVVLAREAVAWGSGLLTSDRTLTTVWFRAAMRIVFTLADLGLWYALLNRASTDLASSSSAVSSEPEQATAEQDLLEQRSRGLLVGGLWLAGGIFVTALSYSAAASSPTGGRYMVAYGAVIYGVVRIVRAMTLR